MATKRFWLLALAALAACGGDDDGDTTSTQASNAGAAGAAAQGGQGGSGASAGQGGSDAAAGQGGRAGEGQAGDGQAGDGQAGSEGCEAEAAGAGGSPPAPTAEKIQFTMLGELKSGPWLLVSDWTPQPNRVFAVRPDGSERVELFDAFRVWSMGASADGKSVAFACNDPDQKANFGIDIGDAIQHTWLLDVDKKQVEILTQGNVNDECHIFGPNNLLYLCRRYDFDAKGTSKGYRVGRIDLTTREFSFLTPLVDDVLDLGPTPSPDGNEFLFYRIEVGPKTTRSIYRQPAGSPCGVGAEELRTKADNPRFSPDGKRYLFRNQSGDRFLYEAPLAGGDGVIVAERQVTNPVYSPDGSEVAYLVDDPAKNCSHVEVVRADGSESGKPRRAVDCSVTPGFFSDVAWVLRP